MYFVASLFALMPVLLIVFPYVRDWSRRRDDLMVVCLGLLVAAIGGAFELYHGPPATVVAARVARVDGPGGLLHRAWRTCGPGVADAQDPYKMNHHRIGVFGLCNGE
jgi:hypothetical protein